MNICFYKLFSGISTRMMAGCWWFFCLIMVSSYTANLAAFLTVETVTSPFDNVEELAAQKGAIKYGAKLKGSTFNFFRVSQFSSTFVVIFYATIINYIIAVTQFPLEKYITPQGRIYI